MVSQTQPAAVHLETIYEESDRSLSSSTVNIHHHHHHHHSNPTRQKFSSVHRLHYKINGLISARSVPPVDVHRRRRRRPVIADDKPPIEVRFRDGSKRYIHPLTDTLSSSINKLGIKTKKKYSHPSRYELPSNSKLNGKYRQVLNNLPKKSKKKILPEKSDIVLTIITAADLRQAGVTPPLTSSPDESSTVTITKSHSNSSIDTLHTMNDISFKENDQG